MQLFRNRSSLSLVRRRLISLVQPNALELAGPQEEIAVRRETSAPQMLGTILPDCSSSMSGKPIARVNRGVKRMLGQCSSNPILAEQLRVQLVGFGGGIHKQPFAPVWQFRPNPFTAAGGTPMAEAIIEAIRSTDLAVDFLRNAAELTVRTPYYFLFSDGEPTSPPALLEQAASMIRIAEEERRGKFYAFGVNNVACELLQPLFLRRVRRVPKSFLHLFDLFSQSFDRVSMSNTDEDADLDLFFDEAIEHEDGEAQSKLIETESDDGHD
jgi:uncharacterized protein YegL